MWKGNEFALTVFSLIFFLSHDVLGENHSNENEWKKRIRKFRKATATANSCHEFRMKQWMEITFDRKNSCNVGMNTSLANAYCKHN